MVEISKLSLRSMLYPGATTKIRAHFMGWFGDNGHVNPGYKSNDPGRVSLQVTDMKASGIDSAILDWYGQFNPTINGTGLLLKAECERRKDFDIVLCYDNGLLKAKPANLSDTDYLIQQIKYSKATYMSSPQYGRVKDGRLLALEFGLSSVDWARIVALFPEIAFLHRNSDTDAVNNSGFNKPGAGAFSWCDAGTSSAQYLSDFLTTALKFPGKVVMPSIWKGFDDRLANWSKNRVVDGRDGQLYLDTFAAINKKYDVDHQLDELQVVTWNDYDEQTALEAGVPNGVVLQAQESAGIASVTVASGNAATIDHFEVSVNGSMFVPIGGQSLDLRSKYMVPGSYEVVFKAVGKARVVNAVSPSVIATAKTVLQWS
jgi:hypothetical protein